MEPVGGFFVITTFILENIMTTETKRLSDFQMVRPIPYMGVIWVNHKAQEMGYENGDSSWCNLGQGQPEERELDGAFKRLNELHLSEKDYGYGPVGGSLQLRKAVADMMNRLYRQGKTSQYGPENVSIAAGGRAALSRLFNIFCDDATVLYRNPDYTAYEDLLYYRRDHTRFVCENTSREDEFAVSPSRFSELVDSKGVNVFVLSNPNNPTGSVVRDEALKEYCRIAREKGVLLALDEFYSHYVYDESKEGTPSVSAARYVEDVESDPVVLIDGLTKNQRYPGFRISWIVGPSRIIEAVNRVASALDGGASVPMQKIACEALQPDRFDAETKAVRQCFSQKRRYVLDRLSAMGIHVMVPSKGTFYAWADISGLPKSINEGDAFCLAALEKKVMTIPGRFFDIRPNRERVNPEPLRHWVRFSFGPSMPILREGLDRIEKMINEKKAEEKAA